MNYAYMRLTWSYKSSGISEIIVGNKTIWEISEKYFLLIFFLTISEYVFLNIAVSIKVVPQKRKSVRDNADWYYGWKEFGVD